MDTKTFLEIMKLGEKMKCNTRHNWLTTGRQESVAEHSWRLVLMAYFVKSEIKDADFDKIMKMCLVHDIGEAFTGDIPSFNKSENDEDIENRRVKEFVDTLPEPYRTELTELFDEMWKLVTKEARIYKALDKMEAIISHNEADISTWLPLEYKLNMKYGTEEADVESFLRELRDECRRITEEKIKEEGQVL